MVPSVMKQTEPNEEVVSQKVSTFQEKIFSTQKEHLDIFNNSAPKMLKTHKRWQFFSFQKSREVDLNEIVFIL